MMGVEIEPFPAALARTLLDPEVMEDLELIAFRGRGKVIPPYLFGN